MLLEDTYEEEEDYDEAGFIKSGGLQISQSPELSKRKAAMAQDSESGGEDYEEDFDWQQKQQRQSLAGNKKIKLSLESDQYASENEFEQIKDEDYVEEDDEHEARF